MKGIAISPLIIENMVYVKNMKKTAFSGADLLERKKISVTGRVQGVGFRPFVYRLATRFSLSGFVFNDTKGVTIELQGTNESCAEFVNRLQSGNENPPLMKIDSCSVIDIPVVNGEESFSIRPSDSAGTALSEVTVDTATCRNCLNEMNEPEDFRHRYPFINCTNCGPRYSLIKTIPYDRPNTTMSVFEMCPQCASQYNDPADRRFHAQPVACPKCGPRIYLTDITGKITEKNSDKAITQTVRLLLDGKIMAVKGIGGFHLAADALNDSAVKQLRERKHRDHKPFAMMAGSIEKIKEYTIVSKSAEDVLKSPQSPIVLLPKRKDSKIAPSVAQGVDTFGFMLCYAPLHHLLFAEKINGQGIEVLVMTSGNISEEPLICKNEKALEKLGDIADAFLMHDREIYRQVDDSVIHFIEEKPVPLRRARGYVPAPVLMEEACPQDIFAAGADMKNTFCFVKQNQLICSEHIGDLEDAEVYHHYIDSIEHLRQLFEIEPKVIVCDLHPGYFSTRYAQSILTRRGGPDVKVIQVQHHWAHIASVLIEHGLEGPVIGIECDGTGYGTDGAIWGCECIIASLEKSERFGHLDYYQLAGSDKASKEAIRPALGLLKKAYSDNFNLDKFSWLLKRIENDTKKQQIILEQIEKKVNTVQTSSLGRIFDAVASMLGLGNYNHFDAQLPMALEAIMETGIEENYDFGLIRENGRPILIDLSNTIKQLITDVQKGTPSSAISAKFHNTLAAGLLAMAKQARENTKLNTVALSGGVFCNRYLTNRLIKLLKESGFRVLFNREVPSNDGGIAIGQAAIAANIINRHL
jgi:hydrogenase maturation protein HypF